MANKSNTDREMIQQDTEADTGSTSKASHGNIQSGSQSDSQFDRKMDFDLEDDIHSIEER